WTLICDNYQGAERRAAELLYAGVSAEVPYILTVQSTKEYKNAQSANLLLTGTRESNPLLAQAVRADEVPQGGYLVKVMQSPFAQGKQVAVAAGSDSVQALYAASHFVNEYLPLARQRDDHMPYFKTLFSGAMKEYTAAETPAFTQRGIWTWGHCIYDYRRFAQHMAQLRLNEIILWNDYAPLNLKDAVACFHEYGIKVIFGYSWGWDEGVKIGCATELAHWCKQAVEVYARDYAQVDGDGIYIQSFTETDAEDIDGVPI
ncbi:MAG: hypothetical protein RRZ93_06595, partial [Ruthenibacterium sp.]